jgi:hypothetical protein
MSMMKTPAVSKTAARHIDRVHKAAANFVKNRDDFPKVTLDLAAALCRLRDAVGGDDRAFGALLDANGLASEISHQDRAALIQIGRHAKVAAPILQRTTSRSPRLIWENELRPRVMEEALTSAGKEVLVRVMSDRQESVPINVKVFHESDPTANLAADPDHRVATLHDVLFADSVREFQRFREKYARLPMWAPVFDHAAAMIEEEKKMRAADPTSSHQKPRMLQ